MKSPDETRTERVEVEGLQACARVGTTVAKKWHLDALLGAGGMAAVYAATHRNGSRAALKILHLALSTDRAVRGRFQREGYAANAVGHPGVVRVLDDDVLEDGSPFLVTELLDGETLEDRRGRLGGRLSVAEVLTYTDALLDVLVAAHSNGVVHRDLKPDNLFLTRTGQLKVLDFGIARIRDLASDSQFTKNGALLGTPRFMSPEQARGLTDDVDAQSDLWACGATMFDLLSGRPVFDAPTPHQVLMLAATVAAPTFESVWPDAPPSVASVVDRALAFEKKDRWPDAAAMQQAVRFAYCDRRGGRFSPAPPQPPPGRDVGARMAGRAPSAETVAEGKSVRRSAGPQEPPALRERAAVWVGGVRPPADTAAPTRHPPRVPAVPILRSTLSDGISDQTLTPTNPEKDKRPSDRPVAATVPPVPPLTRRMRIALPAFVLGAGVAASLAMLVRPGRLPARSDVSFRESSSRATAEARPAASAVRAPARAIATAEAPRPEPPPAAMGPESAATRSIPPASTAANARAAPRGSPERDVRPAASGTAGASGMGTPTSGAGLPATIRRNCMRLDDPGADGGSASRVVCL
ncbi:MAG TPA: protein kinase [Polyangiaceae bacterium]|nr:protein kinase [Polyangiaceae bacterium]